MAFYPETLFQEIADEKKRAFLAAYAHTGRITAASKASQVGWRNHYYWLDKDEAYAAAFAKAQVMLGDFLEDEAIRRAVEGWQKPVFYKGEHVDNETVYSDTLLIFALKGAKPEKYKERTLLSGDAGAPLEVVFRYGSRNALPASTD